MVVDGKTLVKLVPPDELIKARDAKQAIQEVKPTKKGMQRLNDCYDELLPKPDS